MMPDPIAIIDEVRRLAATPLWHGFDPCAVPVAIATATDTWLFQHPHQVPGFRPDPQHPAVQLFPDRHESVRANSTVELDGVPTATVLIDEDDERPFLELAALVVHETFHVFQRERHPEWIANEAELFLYPIEDVDLLQLRRLETAALRGALTADEWDTALGWAMTAIELRRERFRRLSPNVIAYERGTELQEGLAQYVEHRALDTRPDLILPEMEFPADAIRRRCYAVGHAFAVLLNRCSEGWKERLEVSAADSLDELLAAVLTRHAAKPIAFPARERERMLQQARDDIAQLLSERSIRREQFLTQPGWQVVVVASARLPLMVHGFDPMHVERVGQGEVLHTRWVVLVNAAGRLEVLDGYALTEAAGDHPLFDGVSRTTIAGLTEEPLIQRDGAELSVRSASLSAVFYNASIDGRDEALVIRLNDEGE